MASTQLENVEYFNYLGGMITNDARLSPGLPWKRQHSTRKRLFTSKLGLNSRKKLVKCYILSTALYGAETRTLQKVDQKYLESFEMWFWRRMEMISWTNCVRNEQVLHRVNKEQGCHRYNKRKKG
jgi:hypothetical protein